jgi:HD superfamily phosphohydrolase
MPVKDRKTVHDPVHGGIYVDGVFLELLQRHELQRLQNVKQLGLANLVFPGANHTRLEHSLGTYHLIGKMARALDLDDAETDEVKAAAMLHDIAHPAFSHTLEEIMEVSSGLGHMEMGKALIQGSTPHHLPEDEVELGITPSIAEVLEGHGISSRRVTDIIVSPQGSLAWEQQSLLQDQGQAFFGNTRHLNQMIHGPVDADQMDYLQRDAHYTGVAHGAIDAERLLNTIGVHNGTLVVSRGGIVAAEGMMVARALMYTSIYYHRTVRIAEMMLCKALEAASPSARKSLHLRNDAEVLCSLLAEKGEAGHITKSILRRHLYKKAISLSTVATTDEQRDALAGICSYQGRKEAEAMVAQKAGVKVSEVIVDLPSRSSLFCMLRAGKTDIPIWDGDKVRPISRYSPLAKALQTRDIHDWTLLVSCPAKHRESVQRAAQKVLFD